MIKPMLCETGTTKDLARSGYASELKIDGTRAIIIRENGKVTIQNRHGIDYTHRLPELVKPALMLPKDCVLDGEVVCIDGYGHFDFVNTQRRCSTQALGKVHTLSRQHPVTFLAFDILRIGEEDLRQQPWIDRKLALRCALGHSLLERIRYLEHRFDVKEFFERVKALGGEGVVLKQVNSPYEHGRSLYWLKVKVWNTETCDVVGWTESSKGRPFGSLVLAKDGRHVGEVGSGFTDRELREIATYLRSCPEIPRPFIDIDEPYVAVESAMKVEVKFLEWTKDGKLRHPVFMRKV